ncbi:hypothetical protein DAPPUDRAFT_320151 [Daphnia pulex]|uniref:Uncharacterized protein n=1 Tax=Daphnia pulex TaxID=6669 RepID=E9GP03_DAPPU|nr:hypothetical protein DAPPUDRAFT_320151 [Daphnia pulex]|eukprot:EFX78845.1 hypothetical protein DAPPUDRAFT_320151 [Daphnia pulex]
MKDCMMKNNSRDADGNENKCWRYSILEANVTSLEDAGPKFPGLISYALRGVYELNCIDIIAACTRPTSILPMEYNKFYYM